ncbi:o-succinylbenzoate synthase [Roseivirga misakiensis]|uniref:O-succinylbenzoate synthase n=1 Tax=Roseivirga misakiensis TaxID=1563681 RepID=A0A1E5T0D6_9BACT|nr:o-succinylbenzoate synthase [Roseivirga misakiensis]OEK04833.1 o-succinylbenzoate synthase [Roseivirga misakiensis]
MKVQFQVVPHLLKFRFEAGTSRGSFTEKETWFIKAKNGNTVGIGEASPLKGLSDDYCTDYEEKLKAILDAIAVLEIPETPLEVLDFVKENVSSDFPSIRFGLETALLDLTQGGNHLIFDTDFYQGNYRMPINGLIWMGDESFMREQVAEKLKAGFNTIKMKVGAINFDRELSILEAIRAEYSANEITLRVDANGAFHAHDVEEKLMQLAALDIHSIEQPVAIGQSELMAKLCASGVLPIALDEELIGVHELAEKEQLLRGINPQYIILKPSLVGGIQSCIEWIDIAESMNIGWWMTSMLESNVGLNAIAQFTAQYKPTLPQGLGTGQLYHNNIASPLEIRKGELLYNSPLDWQSI